MTSPLKVPANNLHLVINAGIATSSDSAPNAQKIKLKWPWCLLFNITTAHPHPKMATWLPTKLKAVATVLSLIHI